MEVKATLMELTDKQYSVDEVLDETLVAHDITGLSRLAAAMAKKRVSDKMMEGSAPLLQGEAALTETIIKYGLAIRMFKMIDLGDVLQADFNVDMLWKFLALMDDSSLMLKAAHEHDPACVDLADSIDLLTVSGKALHFSVIMRVVDDSLDQYEYHLAHDTLRPGRVYEICAILQNACCRCTGAIEVLDSLGDVENAEFVRRVLKRLTRQLARARGERTTMLVLLTSIAGFVLLVAAIQTMDWMTSANSARCAGWSPGWNERCGSL